MSEFIELLNGSSNINEVSAVVRRGSVQIGNVKYYK
jgi:hypothetical protein